MRNFRIIMVLMLVGILVAGCSQEADLTAPDTQTGYDKYGTEELGLPSVIIADGSGFVEGGVGMVDTDTGNFDDLETGQRTHFSDAAVYSYKDLQSCPPSAVSVPPVM